MKKEKIEDYAWFQIAGQMIDPSCPYYKYAIAFLRETNDLCEKVGAELHSRQLIATIVNEYISTGY